MLCNPSYRAAIMLLMNACHARYGCVRSQTTPTHLATEVATDLKRFQLDKSGFRVLFLGQHDCSPTELVYHLYLEARVLRHVRQASVTELA